MPLLERRGPAIWSVTQLCGFIQARLQNDTSLQNIYVTGELSRIARRQWYTYVDLKDGDAIIALIMKNAVFDRLPFVPADGMKVVVQGSVRTYIPQSKYQLMVTGMQEAGVGDSEQALRLLKEKLEREGAFDRPRKPLPARPKRIAVVTSHAGDALHDITERLSVRYPMVKVLAVDAVVQGKNAPASLIRSLRYADTLGCDLIIIGRGGGSKEDLAAFDDEGLAYAIMACQTPVLSAVGHQQDYHISDMVADAFAITPTDAVLTYFPARDDLLKEVADARGRLDAAMSRRLERERQSLRLMTERLAHRAPSQQIEVDMARLTEMRQRLDKAAAHRLERETHRLEADTVRLNRQMERLLHTQLTRYDKLATALRQLDPLLVLHRGYAAVYDAQGALVSSVDAAAPGDTIRVRLQDGELTAKVEETNGL